jgi:hypothetical protein
MTPAVIALFVLCACLLVALIYITQSSVSLGVVKNMADKICEQEYTIEALCRQIDDNQAIHAEVIRRLTDPIKRAKMTRTILRSQK